MSSGGEVLEFFTGCDFEEFKRYLERAGRYEKEGELDWLETFLRKGLLNLIVWRLDGEVVGNAIWHESNTDEHRKGDPRDEEDREALRRLLGGKRDFVELHEVWLLDEYRGKGYGERFFEFFEEYMRRKGYDRIVFLCESSGGFGYLSQARIQGRRFYIHRWSSRIRLLPSTKEITS
jgi:GNAT superfamily N-acetyltransferase